MTPLAALAVAILVSVSAPPPGTPPSILPGALPSTLPGPGAPAGTVPTPVTTGPVSPVGVTIRPSTAELRLGDGLDLTVTVDNATGAATPPLVVHLDVTDPGRTGSVDPEDWTTTLSTPVGVLAPGQTRVVDWHVQPVSAGSFTVYAVALSAGEAVALSAGEKDVAVSDVAAVEVTGRRSLNPGSVLTVAFAVPGLVGAVLLTRLRRPRRHHRNRTDSINPGS